MYTVTVGGGGLRGTVAAVGSNYSTQGGDSSIVMSPTVTITSAGGGRGGDAAPTLPTIRSGGNGGSGVVIVRYAI